MKVSAERRFWRHVKFMPSGCWEWQASLNEHGYAQLNVEGRMRKAHRWVYERTFGDLPSASVVVRHTCDNPRCVRVAHMVTGSQLDNSRDMVERGRQGRNQHAGKKYCLRGHEFTPANTLYDKKGRACRTCRLALQRDRRRREAAGRTHCAKGHLFSAENPCGPNGCRQCRREITRQRWARTK